MSFYFTVDQRVLKGNDTKKLLLILFSQTDISPTEQSKSYNQRCCFFN